MSVYCTRIPKRKISAFNDPIIYTNEENIDSAHDGVLDSISKRRGKHEHSRDTSSETDLTSIRLVSPTTHCLVTSEELFCICEQNVKTYHFRLINNV